MKRVFSICVLFSLQMLECLTREKDPSVGEYFLEAVDLMNRTQWRYFLPEDTDIDQDGNLSDLEVQHKFKTYMGEVFKLFDHNKDNSITEEELRSLKLEIPQLTKAVDIALENWPLKPLLIVSDVNGDGVYDENDFYMPEKAAHVDFLEKQIETNVMINDRKVQIGPRYPLFGVAKIGQNEGTVICKSLGYEGLDTIIEAAEFKCDATPWEPCPPESQPLAFTCQGTEARLEDCREVYLGQQTKERGMGVECRQSQISGVRLIGGKDSSSGDIFLGEKGLNCVEWSNRLQLSQVVCRELGFLGVLQMTKQSAFLRNSLPRSNSFQKILTCTGDEEKLADCQDSGRECLSSYSDGVICNTDGRPLLEEGLEHLITWPHPDVWEIAGRFLFIADANADGKLTVEELATKAKELLTKILEFLDTDGDGHISLEDFTSPSISVGSLHDLTSELFDDLTAGEGEIDLLNMKLAGQDMSKFWGNGAKDLDKNGDEKINAADVLQYLKTGEKSVQFILMASEKLDKNQDGKIQEEELRQFIDEMFNQVDMDKNGALNLEDAYILLRENGLDCFQVGALRSFIKVFLDTIDTEASNFFGYLFHQFDMDGNGQISSTELEQMHVPCDLNFVRSRVIDFDSNVKRPCEFMFDIFKIGALISSFPDSIFSERHGRGGGGYRGKRWGGDGHGNGRGGRDEPRRETLVDKLTNRACEMLT